MIPCNLQIWLHGRRATSSESAEGNSHDFIHFSGHGDYQGANADLSTLRLLNGPLNALTMNGARFLRASNPIIYLNACHAGAVGRVVGRAG